MVIEVSAMLVALTIYTGQEVKGNGGQGTGESQRDTERKLRGVRGLKDI
jgi:hypothetical protein